MIKNKTGLALLAVAAVGCGGGSTTALPSLYRGAWTGTWTSPTNNNEGGTIAFTVANDGSVTGSMTNSGGSGTLSGLYDGTGHLTATAGFGANGNYLITGSGTLSSGHIVGSFNYIWLGRTYQGSYDVAGSGASTGG